MTVLTAATRPSLRLSSRSMCARAPGAGRQLQQRVNTTRLSAYVEPSVTVAVSQQAAAYIAVLGAEAAYTRTQLGESDKGRPEWKPVGAGMAGTAAALLLSNSGVDFLSTPGFIIGFVAASAMVYYHGKRWVDTKNDESDWPGPKAWPAAMVLISFFAWNLFLQALEAEF